MDNWLSSITAWLLSLWTAIFTALVDLIKSAVVWALDLVLGPVGDLIHGIAAPSFMTGSTTFTSLVSGLPTFSLYVLSHLQLGAAFTVLLTGVLFRLTRKLFTLGQW